MIRTLFFDFGNVLGFFDHRKAIRKMLPLCDVDEQTFFTRVYDSDLEHAFEADELTPEQFLVGVRDRTGYRGSDADFRRDFVDIFDRNPATLSLIPELAKRVRLVLASNTNRLHAAHFRESYADVLHHFFALGVSYEARHRKPQPGFFAHCQTLALGAPNESLFVDDIAANVAGARAFGWQAIHYTAATDLVAELAAFGIDIPLVA